jgi:hypothetical protein
LLLDFAAQVLVVACHWPPFFSQSALVLYCDMSVDDPLPLVAGLAEGDVDEPPDEVLEPLELEPLLSELPDAPEPACAAARLGARPMTATSSANSSLFMAYSSWGNTNIV